MPRMTRATVRWTLILAAAAWLPAQQAGERSFATPQEAAQALVDAAEKNDTAALLKLFGPQGADIVQSGDAAEDKDAHAEFARRAHEKMEVRIEPANPNRATIIAGAQDWPFPVPLVRVKATGKWHFDAARGRVEILARRVGRNELVAIDVCRAYVEAQMEYASRDRDANGMLEYARKMVSAPGKRDGLYWEGEAENLVPKAFADAAAAMAAEGKKPTPYHGYYFRTLTAQGPDAPGGERSYIVKGMLMGGFAMVAYPAEYEVSGIKTFLVNHRGVVYEKDLGPTTGPLASQMVRFNPNKTWRPVQGE